MNEKTVTITESKSCKIDTDCILFQPDCEDCKFEAVSKNSLSELQEKKKAHCNDNPPKTQCDLEFNGDVKCFDNTCTLTP